MNGISGVGSVNVATWQNCSQKCRDNSQCRFWSWRKVSPNDCHLKESIKVAPLNGDVNDMTGPKSHNDFISGEKSC